MFEILTLVQTGKLAKKMQIILYGSSFWKEVLNFDALVKHGMIAARDLELFQFADDPGTALEILQQHLIAHAQEVGKETPAIAETVK
jgi:predicted Rossmann-fold nucleotide-binding protein